MAKHNRAKVLGVRPVGNQSPVQKKFNCWEITLDRWPKGWSHYLYGRDLYSVTGVVARVWVPVEVATDELAVWQHINACTATGMRPGYNSEEIEERYAIAKKKGRA